VSEFRFQEPWVGSWNSAYWDTAWHEAAHAVIADFEGLQILESRIDRPDPHVEGIVRVVPDMGNLLGHFRCLLAGRLAHPLHYPPLSWPLDSEGPGDEGNAARVAAYLDLTQAQFDVEVGIVRQLLRLLSGRQARLQSALLERGAIPGDEVHQILISGSTVPAADPERSRPVASRQVGSTPVGVA